jgi:hypothetical protein
MIENMVTAMRAEFADLNLAFPLGTDCFDIFRRLG